ncbi:MAG: DUF4412 domain-containing protein [Candidatus Saganbacteria bacterium]|nr:DUF4412 domain-containing protein [Candidatus Saganbacteria bacterium]
MKRLLSLTLGLSLLVIGTLGCSSGGPGAPKEFSATNEAKFGGRTMTSKIYFGKDKWRVESSAFGQKTIAIVRADKNVMWNIMPQQKMYMEMKLDPKQMVGKTTKLPGELSRKKVSSEKVSGLMCDKYKITYKPNEKASEMSVYQWISKDNIPVKTAATDGSWYSLYKDVKVGAQPDSLFDLPGGYKKFSMPKMPKF